MESIRLVNFSSLSRFTGEMIYGSSLGAFAEQSQEYKMLIRALKNKKRTADMVEEVQQKNTVIDRSICPSQVGGKKVWDTLEWKLWRNISDAQPMVAYTGY